MAEPSLGPRAATATANSSTEDKTTTTHKSHLNDAYHGETDRKLVKKIDLYLMPTMWFINLLAIMDRSKSAVPPPRRHTQADNAPTASAML